MNFINKWILGLFLAVLGTAQIGNAHNKDVERTLFVQVDDQGLVALWAARSSVKKVQLQGQMVDLDRNGKLSPAEKKLLAASLLQKGMAGVTLDYAGKRLEKPNKIETRLKEVPVGSDFVEALGMASYDAQGTDKESLAVEIRIAKGYGPLTIQFQALGGRFIGWVNRAVVAPDRKGLAVPVLLKAEETMKVVVVKGEAPKPKEKKNTHSHSHKDH